MQFRVLQSFKSVTSKTSRCTKTIKRTVVRPTRATSVRDQDLTEDVWLDWYKESKWKQHLGTRGVDDLDKAFLESDFLDNKDLEIESKPERENFEDFTADIIDFELKPRSKAPENPNVPLDEKFDVPDDDYHEAMKLFEKATVEDIKKRGELKYITDLREKLAETNKRSKDYEVVLPTGEVVDYEMFKDSLSQKADRRKLDPYKHDHRNQIVDMAGRTFGRGSHKTARATVVVVENPQGEGMTYVNGHHYVTYFPQAAWRLTCVLPLLTTGTFRKYDVFAFLRHGGKSGQSVAMRLALARCLLLRDPSLRLHLQPYGFLTRDRRFKGRKLPGKLGIRKSRKYKRR